MQTDELKKSFRPARVLRKAAEEQGFSLELRDKEVKLTGQTAKDYEAVINWLHSTEEWAEISEKFKVSTALPTLIDKLSRHGLLINVSEAPRSLAGSDFYTEVFAPKLEAWLGEAFSHPFWERMLQNRGSARLFTGWLFELFHFTKNANRHMPLAVSTCQNKRVKTLLAKHYEEEWNHYFFFIRALAPLGYSKEQVLNSSPLPMTVEMANFMRQAAREHTLCYAVCSAVLEGTTVNRDDYNPFYEKCGELYSIPKEAIKPIYDHLDLDVQYGHSNLFQDVCNNYTELSTSDMNRILTYGRQMVEHIWLWTDNIEKYYDSPQNRVPRTAFSVNDE